MVDILILMIEIDKQSSDDGWDQSESDDEVRRQEDNFDARNCGKTRSIASKS